MAAFIDNTSVLVAYLPGQGLQQRFTPRLCAVQEPIVQNSDACAPSLVNDHFRRESVRFRASGFRF